MVSSTLKVTFPLLLHLHSRSMPNISSVTKGLFELRMSAPLPRPEATPTYLCLTPPRRPRMCPCRPHRSSFSRCTWARSPCTPHSSVGILQQRVQWSGVLWSVDHNFDFGVQKGRGEKGAGLLGPEGGGTGVCLLACGWSIDSCLGNCQSPDRDAVVMPSQLLPGAGSDSTRQPVYLITRLETLDARVL